MPVVAENASLRSKPIVDGAAPTIMRASTLRLTLLPFAPRLKRKARAAEIAQAKADWDEARVRSASAPLVDTGFDEL